MPEQQFIAPLPGIQILKSIETLFSIILNCTLVRDPNLCCPHCSAKDLRIKAHAFRRLKHAIWASKVVTLELRVPKFFCKKCEGYFMAPIPGVLPKKRASEQFRQEVFQLHHGGITQKGLSITHQIGSATVERWYQDFVGLRIKELSGRSCPAILGIDEHFFSRKQGYATTLVDLRNHKVFDVALGRSENSLKAFLSRLPGKDKVRVVVMDLSETYRSIVRKYFPNALIVADRFHVIRLLNHHFLKVWQTLDETGRKNRGLLSLMRRHEWNLSIEQRAKLNIYFAQIPGLKALYEFKQDLAKLLLLKSLRRSKAKEYIPQLLWHMNECLESPWEQLQILGKTLDCGRKAGVETT